MGINLVVAVTDGSWFDMLRRQPNLDEVNFWAPSPTNFQALQPGELFLFKLHAPRNFIVGGGYLCLCEQASLLTRLGIFQGSEWRAVLARDARSHRALSRRRSE
ncbi:hypothetical protein [Taklimakanibacter deserti]|uniref:hypothetical protein n=1 Tax=Taklimakanibacter deserti TaxID=2267839 RepID=UPI0034D7896C